MTRHEGGLSECHSGDVHHLTRFRRRLTGLIETSKAETTNSANAKRRSWFVVYSASRTRISSPLAWQIGPSPQGTTDHNDQQRRVGLTFSILRDLRMKTCRGVEETSTNSPIQLP